jgi:hypothetical protein
VAVKAAVPERFCKGLSRIMQKEPQGKTQIVGPAASSFPVPESFQGMLPYIAFGMKFLGMIHVIQGGKLRP